MGSQGLSFARIRCTSEALIGITDYAAKLSCWPDGLIGSDLGQTYTRIDVSTGLDTSARTQRSRHLRFSRNGRAPNCALIKRGTWGQRSHCRRDWVLRAMGSELITNGHGYFLEVVGAHAG